MLSRLPLVMAAVLLVALPYPAAAAARPVRAGGQQKAAEHEASPAPYPVRSANGPEFAESESGCAEGRVRDYLDRHGDYGVIDATTLLEMTRQVQRERESEKFVRANSIGGSVWFSIGPTNGAGRATAVAIHPTVPGNAIIGAAGGGAWRTADGGATWTALTDTIPNLSVGAIEIAPSNPNIVYLGTGEGGNAIDFIPGIGLLYSSDGGNSWTLPASVLATQFYKMSVNPANPSDIIVATNSGAMRSTNGQNGPWTTVIASTSTAGVTGYRYVTDLVRDPTNDKVLFAATWDGRYWCANRGCSDPNNFATPMILKSTDGGQTWTAASTGLPVSTKDQRVNRWAIAMAPSSPQTLYAATSIYDNTTAAEVSHIYKTTDGGATWSETSLVSNSNYGIAHYLGTQGWYDNTIVVSPTDPNTVLAGGVTYVKSTDGGATWGRPSFNGSSVHVDAHELRYDTAGTLFIANDGGIWTTPDSGNSAVERNTNLVTRQYYAIANDPSNRNRVFGGTQDNGTTRRPDSGASTWDYFTGGDGIQCDVNPLAPNIVYSTYQYAAINRSMDGGASAPTLGHVTPLYESGDQTPFLSRLFVDPNNPAVVYTVTHRVWKSTTGGDSWLPLPMTTTDGSTWSTKYILTAAAVAKSDSNTIMVAQAGTVFRSTNGGSSWVKASTGLPPRSVNGLEIDPRNPQVAYAALAGMAGTSVYMTQNGGASWTARGNGLPSFSALVVRVDPTDSSTLYCGTDVGVYRSTDGGGTWARFGSALPAVSVYDIQILADGSIVRAGTHGRGVWELAVSSPTNSQPVATITNPPKAVRITRGTALQFGGSVSDADEDDAVSGTWMFPDTWQMAPLGAAVQHEFDRAGRFPVTLAAKDSHGGIGTATVDVTVLDPADDCSTPIVIPPAGPFPYTTTFDIGGATKQSSDPQSGGSCYPYGLQATEWLSFTPATTGTYQFSTCGSSIATVLIGYSGDACGPHTATTLCYTNTNPTTDCASDPDASALLTAGVPVHILVSSYYYGYTGPISVTVTQNSAFTPAMQSVIPMAGTSAGGTQVTITGTGFTSSTSVSFGGTPAASVTYVTPSILIATTPAHASGAVDVAVTNAGGSPATLGRAFTYAGGSSSKRRAVRP